jgi:hypothetical protein
VRNARASRRASAITRCARRGSPITSSTAARLNTRSKWQTIAPPARRSFTIGGRMKSRWKSMRRSGFSAVRSCFFLAATSSKGHGVLPSASSFRHACSFSGLFSALAELEIHLMALSNFPMASLGGCASLSGALRCRNCPLARVAKLVDALA